MATQNVRGAWIAAFVGVVLLALTATDGAAQVRRYEGLHPDWLWVPGFDSSRVDDCYGHCGAGCGDGFSICGDRNTLVRRIDGPLQSSTFEDQMECRLTEFVPPDWPGGYLDGEWHSFTATRYTAPGAWVFEGQWHGLCETHDDVCRSAGSCLNPVTYLGHLIVLLGGAMGCDAIPKDFGYNETFYRWVFTEPWPTGRSCQVWVGSTSG